MNLKSEGLLDSKTLELLKKVGAVMTQSHFVYTSGQHGSAYVNKDAIYPHTALISELCLKMAQFFVSFQVDCVIAPATGGIILSQWVAHHLSRLTGKEVLGVYAEKSQDQQSFVIKRGYDQLCRSKRVLIAEDILTTGGSVKKVVQAVRALPAQVVGVAALCNRGDLSSRDLDDVPELYSLTRISLESWSESHCPLCHQGVPINLNVGKGRESVS